MEVRPSPMYLKKEFLERLIERPLPKSQGAHSVTNVDPLDDRSFVTILYRQHVNREPDATGMAFYLERLASGVSRSQIRTEIEQSEEAGLRIRSVVPASPYPTGILARIYSIYSKIWQLHRLDRIDRKQDLIMQQTEQLLEKLASRQAGQIINVQEAIAASHREFSRAIGEFNQRQHDAASRIEDIERQLCRMEVSEPAALQVKVVPWGPYLFGFPAQEWRLAAYLEHRGHPEPATLKAIQSYLGEGMTFVDIGASFGLLTIPAAAAVGSKGFVQAWEPDPMSFEILSGNIQLNNLLSLRTVELLPFAAGRVAEQRLLYLENSSRTYSSLNRPGAINPQSISVKVRSLDEMIPERKVDLLKIDAEGYEPEIFDGATKALKQGRIGAIVVEFAPALLRLGNTDPATWLDSLRAKAQQIWQIDESTGELAPADTALLLNAESTNLWLSMR